ncbi:MAG: hypothetical protein KJ771_03080 [Nanoarchaeota archaeon]|nr:hypothetical protein [Nanoarchaeota archaeon]
MEFKWRKSKSKEDTFHMAEELSKVHDISPYTLGELSEVISAGIRSGAITKEKRGQSYIVDLEEWFTKRLMVNTITLSEDDYKKALYRSFRLLVVADIAKTDFGSSRQRDFGQRWTDFTRGFLGEIGIEQFFKRNLGLEIDLEESEVGDVKQFLPTDITKVKDNGQWRNLNTNISIKTSKLKSMWLDIGSQVGHSDAFIFIKIALTTDHLVSFIKSNGFLEKLVRMGQELGEVTDYEKEIKLLCENIPDVKPFPAYISGFVWKKDMENGTLRIHETAKNKVVVGGIGYYGENTAKSVEGLGDISSGKHLASLDSLRWKKSDWEKLKNNV